MHEPWTTIQPRLDHAHTLFQQVAANLPSHCQTQTGACGDWTPKQVAAHLAGWDREAARALHALVAGAPEDLVTDIDTFNHASVAARAHLSWDGTYWELRRAHEALQHAIADLINAQKPAAGYLPWMEGRLADYALHTAQLRAWEGKDR
jgi:hypothetical protein